MMNGHQAIALYVPQSSLSCNDPYDAQNFSLITVLLEAILTSSLKDYTVHVIYVVYLCKDLYSTTVTYLATNR